MVAFFRRRWELVRDSMWFIPLLIAFGGITLAVATVNVDIATADDFWPEWFRINSADGARAILSTLSSSIMTVAGVAFSITVVTLTLAAGQYGPRLPGELMQDRGNQFCLGMFVGIFLYGLFVQRTVREYGEDTFVPTLAIAVAMMLALIGAMVLIYFIHHVSVLIQSDTVVSAVARELRRATDSLFPEALGDDEPVGPVDVAAALPPGFADDAEPLRATGEGYIRTLDLHALMTVAVAADAVIEVRRRPGDFVIEGDPLLSVWPPDRLSPAAARRARTAFVLGSLRTTEQDTAFGIDQLVEVALRALSPGINDPFTAIACIDRLRGGLARLIDRRMPSPLHRDPDGMLRLIAHPRSVVELLGRALHPIRPSAAEHPLVVARLLDTLVAFAERARRRCDKEAIALHGQLLADDAAAALGNAHDQAWIAERAERVRAALGLTRPARSADAGAPGPTSEG